MKVYTPPLHAPLFLQQTLFPAYICSRAAWILTLVLCLLSPLSCRADVILSIDNVTVAPGQTAVVGVYAASDSGDILTGFNLPLDFNNDGPSPLIAGFSFGTPTLSNILYANTNFDIPASAALAQVDAIPTGSGASITLSAIPTKLFDLRINVAPFVAQGTVVPISIEVPQAPLSSLFNIAGFADGNIGGPRPDVLLPTLGVPALGSITVSVVPEPSTLGIAALSAIGVLVGRRRGRSFPSA